MRQTLVFLVALFLLTACAQQPMPMDDSDMNGGMDHDMHMMEVTSEAEFVIEMIPHHQEAVDTSIIVRDSTENAALKDLAERIITAQEEEIAMMNGWVDEWYEPYEPRYMNMMPDLLALEGVERDNAFLEGMIAHHEMAVQMAEDVLALEPREEVAEFARAVIDVQTSEIEEMRGLLDE